MKASLSLRNLAAVAVGASVAAAGPVRGDNSKDVGKRVENTADFNAVAKNFAPLRRVHGDVAPRARNKRDIPYRIPNSSLRNMQDIYYLIDIMVGNQTVSVNLDTGSSDTWFVQEPFQCVSVFGAPVSPDKCGFGEGFKGNFSQGILEHEQFIRSYADGTFATGFFGYEDVTIGGLTAKHQQLALVNFTHWYGDSNSSGLLGLAYPYMTGVDGTTAQYDPVFTTMWKDNLTSPMFSLALSRYETSESADDSYIAFGGVPPVNYDESSWVQAPIQPLNTLDDWDFLVAKDPGLYVITPSAWVYSSLNQTTNKTETVTNTTQFPISVDAGSTLTILPADIANVIFQAFNPPARWVGSGGAWYAPCNATVPTFGVQIGTQVFHVAAEDLLRQNQRDYETNTLCRVGIMDADMQPYVLGVTFLTNVVAVFDVGKGEMRFASRKSY